MTSAERLRTWLRRLAEARPGPGSPRAQRIVAGLTVLALAAATVLAVRRLDLSDGVSWWPLVLVALVLSPTGVLLNAGEFVAAGRMLAVPVSPTLAVRVALQGTAANLLPIPGAAIVRIHHLRRGGATLARATAATAVVGLIWLAVSLLLAGVLLLTSDPWLAVGLLAGGAAAMGGAALLFPRDGGGRRWSVGAAVVALEVAFVVVQALRLWLILRSIGVDATAAQVFGISVSVAAAAAIGFLPGGLGLREALATALSRGVGIPASAGFLASVLDRVLSLVVLTPVAAVWFLRHEPLVDTDPDDLPDTDGPAGLTDTDGPAGLADTDDTEEAGAGA